MPCPRWSASFQLVNTRTGEKDFHSLRDVLIGAAGGIVYAVLNTSMD